jgi:hypothetical protein
MQGSGDVGGAAGCVRGAVMTIAALIACKRISGAYMPPDELRAACESKEGYAGGLSYVAALEMAYENVLEEARAALETARASCGESGDG